MIKKLAAFIAFAAVAILPRAAHAFSPVRYVQISTNAPTQQSGGVNIATGTVGQLTVSSNTVLAGATFYSGGPILLGVAGTRVQISSNTVLPGATFFASGADVRLSTPTLSGPLAMGANKITGLANGGASTDAAAFGQIHLMQAPVCGTISASSATTSAVFAATGLTASITPTSAASSIFVIASGSVEIATQNKNSYATIQRNGSTNLGGSNGLQAAVTVTGGDTQFPLTMIASDSPATTSATTYAVFVRNTDSATTVTFNGANQKAYICLFEVQ